MSLYAHQKEIIDKDPKQCGLFLGTGSGKTRIALELAKGTVLVIAPKTQKEDGNWQREAVKVWGEVNSFKLHVMTFDIFKRDHKKLPYFDTVIVDEAHGMLGVTPNTRQRNRVIIPKASQRYEALEWYIRERQPERLYLCTATIMKSPMTVWGAAQILDKDVGSFYNFRYEFYNKLPMPGREVYAPKRNDNSKEKLASIVKQLGYVGRLDEYFDVPEQTFKRIDVALSAKQIARIKELRMEYPEPIVRVGKTHQVENGVLSGDEFSASEKFPNEKIEKILDFAAEFPRMIIFAKYRAQIDAIRNALFKEDYRTWELTGDTKDRGTVIAEANNYDGILIVQSQVSAGWEVPNTPVVVFASSSYSFVDRVQAEGRVLRANALKKNLYIDLVVKGGVDEAVYDSIVNKKDFDEAIYAKEN